MPGLLLAGSFAGSGKCGCYVHPVDVLEYKEKRRGGYVYEREYYKEKRASGPDSDQRP